MSFATCHPDRRQFLKRHYEKILLVGVLLVLAAFSLVVFRSLQAHNQVIQEVNQDLSR